MRDPLILHYTGQMTHANARPPADKRPIPNSYAVPGAPLYAGEYPGEKTTDNTEAKLTKFLDAGITAFVDLTGPADGMTPYAGVVRGLAAERGLSLDYTQHTIQDMDVCDVPTMCNILDSIDLLLAEDDVVYVHCWGGVGRTGTVIGCWLVRHGWAPEKALAEVGARFRTMSPDKVRRHAGWGSPQTNEQRAMVLEWSRHARGHLGYIPGSEQWDLSAVADTITTHWPDLTPASHITPTHRDRMRGALIGLSVGDAVGTTVEFKSPGSFPPVTDMLGGGPFALTAGEWTDDTSMALCLAESLLGCNTFDARDQMTRYVRWWKDGYLSSTDRCFDIGNTVATALSRFVETNDPMAGSTHPHAAGNGSLMRLAPIPIFYASQPADAIRFAAESSRTTHATPVAVDACRYFAGLLVGAMMGASKAELLAPQYSPLPDGWDDAPLHPTIAAIADGSFKVKTPPAIKGTSYVAETLEAVLWAFHHSDDFRTGCLLAVNLGDDADTTAAIFGQLAGAHYGESAIPAEWRAKLARKPLLDRLAESLFQHAFDAHVLSDARARQAHEGAEQLVLESAGDALQAIRTLREDEAAMKREMGVMGFMGGPMHLQAVQEHTVLHLRIEAALQLMTRETGLR